MPVHPAISDSVFGAAFERSHDAQMLVDDDRRVVAANASAAILLGTAGEQLIGSLLEDLASDGDAERWTAKWPRLVARGGGRGRMALRQASAGLVEYVLTASIADGLHLLVLRPAGFDRGAALRAVADSAHDAVLSLDHDGVVTAANARSEMVLGRGAAELVGRPLASVVASEDAERLRELVRVALGGADVFQFDTTTERPDGRQAHLTVNLAPLRAYEQAPVSGVSVIIQDITRRKRMELELRHQAERDPLTGLYNRRRFEEELHRATRLAERHGHHGALLLLDVDDFKAVNDTRGHGGGDELLRALAQVLAGSIRDSDIPARLGGDEFALLLPRVETPGAGSAAAAKLDGAVRAALRSWAATASIGVADFGPPGALDADRVLAIADEALYRAKAAKGDRAVRAPDPAADGSA